MRISKIGSILVANVVGIPAGELESGSILHTVCRIEFGTAPAFLGWKRGSARPKLAKNGKN